MIPADDEPSANGPADLGWNEQSVTPGPRAPQPQRTFIFVVPEGAPRRACISCHATIYWVATRAGKRMPVDPDGTSHFATCPAAALHRGRPRS